MKKLFIVGNWKSNKTLQQTEAWFAEFSPPTGGLQFLNKEVIICPPFTVLASLKSSIINHKSPIKLGAQDISPFDEGAYTGEVNGKQIKEFADYVLIGHSERRKNFGETNEIIDQKIQQAVKFGLIPIICISDTNEVNDKWKMLNGECIIAYEPLFAIGTGTPDTPENADKMAQKIKEVCNVPVIYGGSVTDKNVSLFTNMSNIDGVLPGKASLDPHVFVSLIVNA